VQADSQAVLADYAWVLIGAGAGSGVHVYLVTTLGAGLGLYVIYPGAVTRAASAGSGSDNHGSLDSTVCLFGGVRVKAAEQTSIILGGLSFDLSHGRPFPIIMI
jgi:hypothetical protein